jgi:hypothetical protein
VKESIQNREFKIQNGCKPHLDRDLRSLNLECWIFDPILSQTRSRREGIRVAREFIAGQTVTE